MSRTFSRRNFIKLAGATGLASTLSSTPSFASTHAPFLEGRKIHIFSKHLQWLDYKHMAEFVVECGFDGADITVRKGGHVEPSRVAEDLPKAVDALRKAGKEVTMITTDILKAEDPHAYAILRTASKLGIQYYRLGWYEYDPKLSIEVNQQSIEVEWLKLSSLNKQLKLKAAYQNHAGTSFGSSVWDAGMLLNKVNSPWIGMQYDIRHATVEAANSWANGFQFVARHINTLDVKDFSWELIEGKWQARNVPLGQGIVDFQKYFSLVQGLPPEIPICLHIEYPIGGAEHGATSIDLEAKAVMDTMQKDLQFLRQYV